MLKFGLLAFLSIFLLTSCSNKRMATFNSLSVTKKQSYDYEKKNLDKTISSLADQLISSVKKDKLNKKNIVFTSLVNLEKLNTTTKFGNAVSESMISELFQRGFNIVDFRGQDAIVVKENGDFYLTKELNRLKSSIEDSYIFVATYSEFDQKSVVLNARILDFDSGEVISAAKEIFVTQDCDIFNICSKNIEEKVKKSKVQLEQD